jgi:hypothetical protein
MQSDVDCGRARSRYGDVGVFSTAVHAQCGRDSGRKIEGRKILGERSNVKDLLSVLRYWQWGASEARHASGTKN